MMKQFEKKQFKQIQTQSQSGRSMVEMLGVLAIIAILSIGGIIMFRYAMNYYQANQIAHEMNIMRTDAQIKIAQGTEKLILGEPYDPISDSQLGHIQFNDDYPVDFACALADDKDVILGVDCHVANAYYIELQNIPEGVCKPLARLISGMDNLIDFYVNEPDAEEENRDICNKDFNTLTVIFGADSDSNAVKCDTDTECELLESTPVCDKPRHVCVQCLTYNDCTNTPDTPQCDTNTNTCKSCYELSPNKPLWDGNECVECPDGQKWKKSAHGCAAYECRTNEDCAKGKYCYFKTEGQNHECNLESGKTAGCYGEWKDETQGGACKDVNSAFRSIKATIKSQEYVVSNESMTWWSACRLCAANAGRGDSDCAYPTTTSPEFMLDISILACNPPIDMNGKNYKENRGYCYKEGTDNSITPAISHEILSDPINELRKTRGCDSTIKEMHMNCPYHFWLRNSYSKDFVYGIDGGSSCIEGNDRNDGDYSGDFGGYAVCHQ